MGRRPSFGMIAHDARPASPPSLGHQLGALLRARRAVGREQRRDAGRAWWLGNAVTGGTAALMVAVAFLVGNSAGSDPDAHPGRFAVILFGLSFMSAGFLSFVNLQESPEAHVLGESRRLIPVSRLRSAVLGMGERQISPAGLWVWAMGVVPWIGLAVAGGSWLTASGWLSAVLLPMVPLMARDVMLGVRHVLSNLFGGWMPAVGSVFGVLVWLVALVTFSQVRQALGVDHNDLLTLPALRLANSPAGPLVVAATTVLLGALALLLHTSRPKRRTVSLAFLRHAIRPRRSAFTARRRELVLLRMMLVQATRQDVYRYSAVSILLLTGMSVFVAGGAGQGLLMFIGYVMPASSFYNLYGPDARYYRLWLATGAGLGEWTRARQAFSAIYVASFSGVVLGGVAVTNVIPGSAALSLAFPILPSTLFALLIGPRVSRFVTNPTAGALADAVAMRNSRRWLATALAIVVYLTLGPVCIGLAEGHWALYALPCGALLLAYLLIRPDRHQWSPDFRDRLARSFR